MPSLAERWFKQGIQEGKQQGIEEGIQKGIREGLYKAIELELKLKFGEDGRRLLKKIRQIKDTEKLQEIIILIEKTKSFKEIEKALKK